MSDYADGRVRSVTHPSLVNKIIKCGPPTVPAHDSRRLDATTMDR
jgi:hypothetical protein